jgi:cytochrome b subunit of formate dehydrogenase
MSKGKTIAGIHMAQSVRRTNFEQSRRWALLSLLNLSIVAILGALLRYKLAFSLPSVNYMHALEAHNQFAFSGWVSLAIFTSFVYLISGDQLSIRRSYWLLFNLAQMANFGMMFSFLIQGYSPLSIAFSFLAIVFSYWFAWQYWGQLRKSNLPLLVRCFAKVALSCFVLSWSPFLLVHTLLHNSIDNNLYHNSIYFFLHFQYNGWFTFAVFAILFAKLHSSEIPFDEGKGFLFFRVLSLACIPAYSLSILWTDPPIWVFVVAAAAALAQLFGVIILLKLLYEIRKSLKDKLFANVRVIWLFSLAAFSIKLVLQALSVVPFLGKYAFGSRSVIIAYLHLVLLVFVTFFLFGFFLLQGFFKSSAKMGNSGLRVFVSAVLINEIVLVMQGINWNPGSSVETTQIILFWIAALIFVGLGLFYLNQFQYRKTRR